MAKNGEWARRMAELRRRKRDRLVAESVTKSVKTEKPTPKVTKESRPVVTKSSVIPAIVRKYRECPHCGKELSQDYGKCPWCGVYFHPEWYGKQPKWLGKTQEEAEGISWKTRACKKCGGDLHYEDGAWTCLQCGKVTYTNPIRHTKTGYWWGSKGPFVTREKAVQVAQAAYASGYKGHNPTLTIPVKSNEQLGHLFKTQSHLNRAGVSFDTGSNIRRGRTVTRDWELDYSLRGARLSKNPKKELSVDNFIGNVLGGLGILSLPIFIGAIVWLNKKYGT